MLVVQNTERFEGRGALFVEVGDVQLEWKGGRIRGAQSNSAAGKVRLDFGPQRNDADVANDDGPTELNQVEVRPVGGGRRIVGKSVEKHEFHGSLVHRRLRVRFRLRSDRGNRGSLLLVSNGI